MKKLFISLISLFAVVAVLIPNTLSAENILFDNISSNVQESVTETADEAEKDSKLLSAFVLIGVFTVTFAVSGVITYKIQRKKLFSDIEKNNSSDF